MKGIKIYSGDKEKIIPIEDYLDIRAMQSGFDDYKNLTDNGMSIEIAPDSIVEI